MVFHRLNCGCPDLGLEGWPLVVFKFTKHLALKDLSNVVTPPPLNGVVFRDVMELAGLCKCANRLFAYFHKPAICFDFTNVPFELEHAVHFHSGTNELSLPNLSNPLLKSGAKF